MDFRKNCDCGIAVAEQHFLKSCGIAIAEVLPSSCGTAIADSKKVARAHLCILIDEIKRQKGSGSQY